MFKRVCFFIAVIFYVPVSYAVSVTGKVVSINTHLAEWSSTDLNQNGVFMITLNELPNACDSSYKRIAIPSHHPLYNTVVSIVLSAQSQSKNITLGYLEKCTYRSNSWDFATVQLN